MLLASNIFKILVKAMHSNICTWKTKVTILLCSLRTFIFHDTMSYLKAHVVIGIELSLGFLQFFNSRRIAHAHLNTMLLLLFKQYNIHSDICNEIRNIYQCQYMSLVNHVQSLFVSYTCSHA